MSSSGSAAHRLASQSHQVSVLLEVHLTGWLHKVGKGSLYIENEIISGANTLCEAMDIWKSRHNSPLFLISYWEIVTTVN